MRKWLKFLSLILVIPWGFTSHVQGQTQVPNFTVTDLNGQPHSLYDYLDSNKFVVIDFFFTNCSFCQFYAPHMQAAYEDFGCNRGNTIFLGIDYGDSTQQVLDFVQTYGTQYPVASGLNGGGDSVVAAYNVGSFPSVYLINPQRYLMKIITSPTTDFVDTVLSLAGCIIQPCNVGIAHNESIDWNIYPNPASSEGFVYLEIEGAPKESWIEIVRADGMIMRQIPYEAFRGSMELKLPKGFYFIRISDSHYCTSRALVIN